MGTVGAAPIELVVNPFDKGRLAGMYLHSRIGTPIGLGGMLRQVVLTLTEQAAHGKPAAMIPIPAFTAQATQLTGTWRYLATSRQLPLVLTPLPASGAASGKPHYELLQVVGFKNSYFRTVLADEPSNVDNRVVDVRLLEKKTNRLVQQFAVDCQSQGPYSVAVSDFNSDDYPDFSVFESSYAGPNTSGRYYLCNTATKRYAPSGFGGTSLEFDAKKHRVYEHNSCCEGSSATTVTYKVVRNRLMLVAQHCYYWDDKRQELVERKFSAYQ